MPDTLANFLKAAEAVAFDREHRQKLNFNIGRYDQTVIKGKQQFSQLELARKKAKNVKWKAIRNLENYLIEFEAAFTARGGHVVWAETADDALTSIGEILSKHDVNTVVKGKSMATEELELNHYLESLGIEVYETDLGEFIVQLAGEKPYHIVTPAMHKSKEDVAQLFHEKLGVPEGLPPRELTLLARKILREKFLQAGAGITGANFIIADTGSIAITENEGNIRMATAFPKVHIAIVGIEKVIPSINDLGLFWPLLATFGTGQKVTVFNTILSGPRQEGEADGPEHMYVILLDNGRTKLLAQQDQREAAYCIRCGACLNACPVYKNIGGHTYGTTYSGPIGSVITPHLKGMAGYGHLSYASSLCGNCSAVCPVHIDIHKLLIYNRRDNVEQGFTKSRENLGYYLWKKGMLNRKLMNIGSPAIKNFVFKMLFKNSWGKHREMPVFPPRTFNQMWQELYGTEQ